MPLTLQMKFPHWKDQNFPSPTTRRKDAEERSEQKNLQIISPVGSLHRFALSSSEKGNTCSSYKFNTIYSKYILFKYKFFIPLSNCYDKPHLTLLVSVGCLSILYLLVIISCLLILKVMQCDTLASIALKFDISQGEIARNNNIVLGGSCPIYPGEVSNATYS